MTVFAYRDKPTTPAELVDHDAIVYVHSPRQVSWRLVAPDGTR